MARNILPIWIMIYFDLLTIIFHHFYNFNLIKNLVLIKSIVLYIPKVDGHLEVLTDEELKDFVATKFSKYFKSIREQQGFKKVAKSLYIFLTKPDEVIKYVQSNSSDNCVHHYNVEDFRSF